VTEVSGAPTAPQYLPPRGGGRREAPGGGLSKSSPRGGTPSLTLPHKGGGDTPPAWRHFRFTALASATVSVIGAAIFATWLHSPGRTPLGESIEFSTVVVDRNGRLLRPYATPDGRWRLPATVRDIDPRYVEMLIAYEDIRFRTHHGVDPLAVGRAAYQLLSNGRIVSGASTITMQVARLLEPRTDRTFGAKLRQAVRAIQLERALSKDEILSLYFALAPYGGNLEGVRAASLAYFGKEPRRLSLAEAAMLVAIPQSPELRRPDRAPDVADRARDRVLDRVGLAGSFPLDEATPRLGGDPEDAHARFLEGVVSLKRGVLRVACLYLPNGNPPDTDKYPYKLNWMSRLLEYSKERLKTEEPLVLAGDFNVIPAARDVHNPEAWVNDALFRPATRERFQALLDLGLTDALRATTDAPGQYTFWDYQAGAWQKNHGLRIDHLLLSPQASDRLTAVGIDKHVRAWEKPSDHVPVWIDLDLEGA